MNILLTHRRKAICIGALLIALSVIAGCAEIQPYNPANHREEGPAKGLFTGSQGEWVILGPPALPMDAAESKSLTSDTETDREQKKNPAKSTDGGQ